MAKKKLKPNCWKVLNSDRGSTWARYQLRVLYEKGRIVRAPVGGLFAFARRKDAESFLESFGAMICAARGKGQLTLPLFNDGAACDDPKICALSWRRTGARSYLQWPKGTVAYKEITVLE